MIEQLKLYWKVVVVVFGFLSIAIPVWGVVYMVLDGQVDTQKLITVKHKSLEKLIDSHWSNDETFNKDWKTEDSLDEQTQQELLREQISALKLIQERLARIRDKQDDLTNEHDWQEIILVQLNTTVSMMLGIMLTGMDVVCHSNGVELGKSVIFCARVEDSLKR